MSEISGQARVEIIPDLTQFTASAVAIGNLVSDAIEFGLKKAADFLKTLPAIGQELQDSFNTVRVQTGLTGDALGQLSNVLLNVGAKTPQALNDIGGAVGILNERFGGLSKGALTDLTQQFADLSTITGTNLKQNVDNLGGALLVFNTKPADLAKRMDEALRATQAAGVSLGDITPTLNSVGASLQGVGFSYEQSLGFVASFAKVGLDASQAQLALGKVAKLAAEDGISASQEWQKLTDTWKNAKTPQDAFAEGAQVLGTRAARMAVLVHDGTLNYQELTNTIAKGSDTITKATADTDTLGREWQITLNQMKEAAGSSAIGLNTALMDVLKQAQPVLRSLITDVGGAIAPAIGQIASVLGPALVSTLQGLAPILASFANLLASVFTASQPLIDAFVDALHQIAPSIAEWATEITAVLVPVMAALGPIFTSLFSAIAPVFQALGNAFVTTLQALAPAFLAVAQAIEPIAGELGQQLAEVIDKLAPLLPQLVQAAIPLAIAFVQVVGSGILPMIIDLVPPLTELVAKVAELTAGLLANKAVLIPLVVAIGGLWAAWKGFEIIGLASKAFVDFQLQAEASLARISATFNGSITGMQADTTTLQGSTRVLTEALDEVIASIQILTQQFGALLEEMGLVPVAMAEVDASLVGLTGSAAGASVTLESLGIDAEGLVTAETAATISTGLLSAALDFLAANPMVLAIAGLAILAGAIYTAYEKFTVFHDGIDTIGRSLHNAFDWLANNPAVEWVVGLVAGLGALALLGPPVLAALTEIAAGIDLVQVAIAGGLLVAIAAVVLEIGKMDQAQQDAMKHISEGVKFDKFTESVQQYDELGKHVDDLADKWNNYSAFQKLMHAEDYGAWQSAKNQLDEVGAHIEENRYRIQSLGDVLGITAIEAEHLGDSVKIDWSSVDPAVYEPIFEKLKLGFIDVQTASDQLKGAIDGQGNSMDTAATKTASYTDSLDALTKKQNDLLNPVFAAMDADDALATAKTNAQKAQEALGKASGKDYPAALQASQQAQEAVLKAVRNQQEAMVALNSSLSTGAVNLQDVDKWLGDSAKSSGLTGDSMKFLTDKMHGVITESQGLTDSLKKQADDLAQHQNDVLALQSLYAASLLKQSHEEINRVNAMVRNEQKQIDFSAHISPMTSEEVLAQYDEGSRFDFEGTDKTDLHLMWLPDGGGDYIIRGGQIVHMAAGGVVEGMSGIDRVPSMLSAGEGVLNRNAMMKLGTDAFNQLNAGNPMGRAAGGDTVIFQVSVQAAPGMTTREASNIGSSIADTANQRLRTRARIHAA